MTTAPCAPTASTARGDVAAHVRSFAERGYALLGRTLSEETLQGLRARADEIMLGRVVIPGLFFQHDADSGRYDDLAYGEGWVGPSLRYRKLEKLERDPPFRAVVEHPALEPIVRALVGGAVSIYRATLFTKGPGGGSDLPWHQDGGRFWGVAPDPTVQVWTALDDADLDGGCLEVLPGSHAGGLATPVGGVVPADHLGARRADELAVPLPAKAGESILLHNHLWHRSARSSSGRTRRALTVCYMSAETRCLRVKRAPREFARVFVDADARAGGPPC